MPRPKMRKGERREETIQIRVTVEEKRALTAAAKRAGLDVSAWLRSLGVRAAAPL